MLGETPEHSVVTYETWDDEAAYISELLTTALRERGCRGAIVDGGLRDVRFILRQDFPVFSRYRTPADAPPRWRLDDWDVPITIGDVEIRPGDVLVGDVDGIICVLTDVTEDILERAEDTTNTENAVRSTILDDMTPIDAYDTFGTF